jgi:hypothetical protein
MLSRYVLYGIGVKVFGSIQVRVLSFFGQDVEPEVASLLQGATLEGSESARELLEG